MTARIRSAGCATAVATIVAVLVSWIGAVAPALAHVESSSAEASGSTDAAGVSTVVFSFDHGCGTEPTVGLRVQLPENVTEPAPVDPPGWTSTVADDVLSWSGGSIPSDQPGRFELRARILGTEGDTVWFKTVQQCPGAEEPWIEIPVAGEPEPENVAPSFTLTQTVEPEATTTTAPPSTTTTEREATSGSLLLDASTDVGPAAGDQPGTTGLIVLVIVLVVIGGGALVLFLRNRSQRDAA